MKINYNRLVELNKEALSENGKDTLSSYYVVQMPVERLVDGVNISVEARELLVDLGVLELSEEDIARENIVGPFNFSQHGSQEA